MYAVCVYCGEQYSARRKDLGYLSCLDCGDISAQKEKVFKSKCVAIQYNKGAPMYITSKECMVGVFKGGEYK